MTRVPSRLNTWKPPESVRIGPSQLHEAVQPAVRGDDLRAGAEVQVVGVAEDDLGAELPQLARLHGLDRRLGAHRHEAGRLAPRRAAWCRRPARALPSRASTSKAKPSARVGAGVRVRRPLPPRHSASMASPKL